MRNDFFSSIIFILSLYLVFNYKYFGMRIWLKRAPLTLVKEPLSLSLLIYRRLVSGWGQIWNSFSGTGEKANRINSYICCKWIITTRKRLSEPSAPKVHLLLKSDQMIKEVWPLWNNCSINGWVGTPALIVHLF